MSEQGRSESGDIHWTGGRILVEALRREGVERVFCVPGESYLPVLDALHDHANIAVVSARHEGAAAFMAEADGKLTGRPGICMVTRGPGATHAAIGVHTAFQDSTPMVLFIGQVERGARDREGFQEVDYKAMFQPLAKWVGEVDSAERLPEYISRAFSAAMAGRPGPVVLSLPEDMLSEAVPSPAFCAASVALQPSPSSQHIEALGDLLRAAKRPLIVVGSSGWTPEAALALRDFAERSALPVVASFRRQDIVDNRHPNYCGHLGLGVDPTLAERLRRADLVVAIGTRLSENTTSHYTLLTPPCPAQSLVHVFPQAEEIGRVYQPRLGIVSGVSNFALRLADLSLPADADRFAWLNAARAAYESFSTPQPPSPERAPRTVDMAHVVRWLSDTLDEDAIVAVGAGNYTVWVHRYFRYRQLRTELAPISGAMGYGVPAAIAAKLRHPDRQVVALAGDGCFQMYPQELATAVQHGANVIFLIVNNGVYGTIRMHQARRFPGRVVATELRNPDFVALARSHGAFGECVERAEDFPEVFRAASLAGRPAVIELKVDPLQLGPAFRLDPQETMAPA